MVKDNQFKPTFKQPFIPQTETRIFLGGRPVNCSLGDRQALSNKIYDYIRLHRNGNEFDIKISNLSYR